MKKVKFLLTRFLMLLLLLSNSAPLLLGKGSVAFASVNPCITVKLQGIPSSSLAQSNVVYSVFTTGTTDAVTNNPYGTIASDGTLTVSSQSLAGTYDVYIKVPGYLTAKLAGISFPSNSCYAMTTNQTLVAGDAAGQNTVTLGDLSSAIRAYNNVSDTQANVIKTAFGGSINLSGLVSLIRNYNANPVGVMIPEDTSMGGVTIPGSDITPACTGSYTTTLNLSTSDDIVSQINAANTNTKIQLAAGVYRISGTIYLKSGDCLTGATVTFGSDPSTVLLGSQPLQNVTNYQGVIWQGTGQTPTANPGWAGTASCGVNSYCGSPYLLVVDNNLYSQVSSISNITAGTYYVNTSTNTYYFSLPASDTASNHTFEQPLTYTAIDSQTTSGDSSNYYTWLGATNVGISSLAVENFDNLWHFGAIGMENAGSLIGRTWNMDQLLIMNNRGFGVSLGQIAQFTNGNASYNGQGGINGSDRTSTPGGVESCSDSALAARDNTASTLVSNSNLSGNNVLGYSTGNEEGNKFVDTNLTFTNNRVENNLGDGFWTDVATANVTATDNTFVNNQDSVHFETSSTLDLENNTFTNNATDDYGVYISASGNATISYNTFTNVANAITMSASIRNDSEGECTAHNEVATHNTMTTSTGHEIWLASYAPSPAQQSDSSYDDAIAASTNFFNVGNVTVDSNTYHVPTSLGSFVKTVQGSFSTYTFAQWQAGTPFDPNSTNS